MPKITDFFKPQPRKREREPEESQMQEPVPKKLNTSLEGPASTTSTLVPEVSAPMSNPSVIDEEWKTMSTAIRYQKDFEVSTRWRIRQISSGLIGRELYWESDHFGRVLITYFIIQRKSGVATYFFYTPYEQLKAFKAVPAELQGKPLEFRYINKQGDIRDLSNIEWVEAQVRWTRVSPLDPEWELFPYYDVSNFGQFRNEEKRILKTISQKTIYARAILANPTEGHKSVSSSSSCCICVLF